MILTGTGHRPPKLGGYNNFVNNRLLSFAGAQLDEIRPASVISGMALGWDQALAHAAKILGIPWHAYIPFAGQESTWPTKSVEHYTWLLRHATSVTHVCAPGYAAWKMQKRNEAMVDACTHVLALWDGSNGGTGNCVMYARRKQKPIINCWNKWRST